MVLLFLNLIAFFGFLRMVWAVLGRVLFFLGLRFCFDLGFFGRDICSRFGDKLWVRLRNKDRGRGRVISIV